MNAAFLLSGECCWESRHPSSEFWFDPASHKSGLAPTLDRADADRDKARAVMSFSHDGA
jgi:hypothetical protein